MIKKVYVASKNPVKIRASQIAFEKIFPIETFAFEGVSVPSDVSDQPMSDEETLTGALNRAAHAKKEKPDANYWIGIEGGIEKSGTGMMAFGKN